MEAGPSYERPRAPPIRLSHSPIGPGRSALSFHLTVLPACVRPCTETTCASALEDSPCPRPRPLADGTPARPLQAPDSVGPQPRSAEAWGGRRRPGERATAEGSADGGGAGRARGGAWQGREAGRGAGWGAEHVSRRRKMRQRRRPRA